eukprot:9339804-Lingulodinium_polyedra.AAC.1
MRPAVLLPALHNMSDGATHRSPRRQPRPWHQAEADTREGRRTAQNARKLQIFTSTAANSRSQGCI